jgi:hypothetical protein
VLPTAPIAAQQGNQIDINIITKDLAKYFGVDNVDHWWKSAVPTDVRLNPYTPQKGEIKSEEAKAEAAQTGVADGRTGLMGAASRNANLMQQQTRDFGRSVKE